MAERVQKLLANAGLGSRREIERWIVEGRVTINDRRAALGDTATSRDRIRVDGRIVRLVRGAAPRQRVVIYHKPIGEVSTRKDPEGRPTVFDHLPRLSKARWISIGRLDLNTCGLILFTTDGELANALMHPSRQIEREYAVRVMGEVSKNDIAQLKKGVQLEDGKAKFEQVQKSGGSGVNVWYRVVLREGRKREVRRLWEAIGVKVSRLIRVRFGPIELPRDLPRGRWRELRDSEIDALYRAAGISGRD